MKLTNRKILQDAQFLGSLTQKDLPAKVSYAIAKNVSKIESELRIYNSERKKLIDKYCIKDEDGNNVIDENGQFVIADENMNDWNDAINELLDIEMDIDIHKFNINDLFSKDYELKPSELMLIDYMIED